VSKNGKLFLNKAFFLIYNPNSGQYHLMHKTKNVYNKIVIQHKLHFYISKELFDYQIINNQFIYNTSNNVEIIKLE
jgi:hypothetical protein